MRDDLTPYYDKVDQLKAERLQQKALARERRGQLSKSIECVFVWLTIVLASPVWLLAMFGFWITGRSLINALIDRYGENAIASAFFSSAIGYVVLIVVSTVLYVNSTRTYCERHAGNLACMQMDIDKQQDQLNKMRSEKDK